MDTVTQLNTRSIAHEIRNHLSICEMYTEIINKHMQKDGYKNDSVSNALDCIKKSLKIINTTLIDLKSINNFEEKLCDLKSLLEEGSRLATAYTIGKDIEILTKIKDTAMILVDDNKFLACIVNIIKNGIEAIETKGKININVEIKNKNAYIKISNDGRAISEEAQKEIFTEGFTTKTSGSGLGLHICKTNLEKQNAKLSLIKSTKDITEFEIILPVQ